MHFYLREKPRSAHTHTHHFSECLEFCVRWGWNLVFSNMSVLVLFFQDDSMGDDEAAVSVSVSALCVCVGGGGISKYCLLNAGVCNNGTVCAVKINWPASLRWIRQVWSINLIHLKEELVVDLLKSKVPVETPCSRVGVCVGVQDMYSAPAKHEGQ